MRNRKIRVLVIDDEQNILDLVRMVLEMEATFEIMTTVDVRCWQNILEDFPADIILVDYRMPAMTGEEFIQLLNLSGLRNSVHAVGLFSATPFMASDIQRMGADFFFEKPFDVDHLLSLLKHFGKTA